MDLRALVLSTNERPFTVNIPEASYIDAAGRIIGAPGSPVQVEQSTCRDGTLFLVDADAINKMDVPLNLPGTLLGNHLGYRNSNVFGPLVVLGPTRRARPQGVPGAILQWVQDHLLEEEIASRDLSSFI